MKWTNRDINIVEWANIPKFSTLDNIVTPLRLFELFVRNVLVDMIFGYTKLYSHNEKTINSFEITDEKIRLFFSMLLLSGGYNLPYRKMYWQATLDTFLLLCKQGLTQCLVIQEIERILQNPHLCGNEQLDKKDKLSKLLPVIYKSNKRFLKFSFNR